MTADQSVTPPDFTHCDTGPLSDIKDIFSDIYPVDIFNDLAHQISQYWISGLERVWKEKSEAIKAKDLTYNPLVPLSRVEQKTVLIAYADSVFEKGEATLSTLDKFLTTHFPAIRGLHILPACEISEERFNDGGFSQVRRDRIHALYGTNEQFETLMEKYYSMTDFVLNHVDIDNPRFRAYLDGDNLAGDCFFVFSEDAWGKRLANGDFAQIFRPRPFPLFTIFRRKPSGKFAGKSHEKSVSELNRRFEGKNLDALPEEYINILFVFSKIKNDQMLLGDDYQHITHLLTYLENRGQIPDNLFKVSKTQETRNKPYIFTEHIHTPENLLTILLPCTGISPEKAEIYAGIFKAADTELFGESIRALTTFSHVQVDLNLTTFEGLKLLCDDFSWYLKMDLNMLRLDAANFAFKKWGTSCFGLPETTKLLKILYLSMGLVSPRMVPNLEVNAPLSSVLNQMADKQAPPPMMYDFHLASMMPVVFHNGDATPLLEIFKMIDRYDIPRESIRFSLDESHDGKSVNGSGGADPLLTYKQRAGLVDLVRKNKGHVKYKSSPTHQYPHEEFKKICTESGLELDAAANALFDNYSEDARQLKLKSTIRNQDDIAGALEIETGELKKNSALHFFITKILSGKEPYELCISTRDALPVLNNPDIELKRYLAFKTLSFALMGRNVKSIYFNDLMGLKNDHKLVKQTGELRNIKRTKTVYRTLEQLISDPSCIEYRIAKNMNHTISLFDSDPSFAPLGDETRLTVHPDQPAIARLHNCFRENNTLIIVNTSDKSFQVRLQLSDYGLNRQKGMVDCITGKLLSYLSESETAAIEVGPFDRFWIKNKNVEIPRELTGALF